jgi:hypothetical protein
MVAMWLVMPFSSTNALAGGAPPVQPSAMQQPTTAYNCAVRALSEGNRYDSDAAAAVTIVAAPN